MAESKGQQGSSEGAERPKPSGPANIAKALTSAGSPASKPVVIDDTFDYETAFRMAFLGTGQGGCRIANTFWNIGYRRVALFNTTDQDFHEDGINLQVPRLCLGGGGAGKDTARAKAQLSGREEEVWDLMIRAWGNGVDCALVCVSLGGGTGSGTAVELVKLARKYLEAKGRPPRVGAIVSLPFRGEGPRIAYNAVMGFRELLVAKVSPLLIIDNSRINEIFKNKGFGKLYPLANQAVSELFHLFNRLAGTRSPYLTFDQSEFAQLLDSGIAVMGMADIPIERIKTPADISEQVRENLLNNVQAAVDLRRGRKAACLFVAHPDVVDALPLDYFDAGFTQLNRILGSAGAVKRSDAPVVVHRGLYPGVDAGLQCYVMVSELDPPHSRLAELAKEASDAADLNEARTPSTMAKFLGVQD